MAALFSLSAENAGPDAPSVSKSTDSMEPTNAEPARASGKFLPVDIEKSHAYAFLPENGGIRMPFSALPGLGENAAQNIIAARDEEKFFSVDDLRIRAKLTKSVIEILRKNRVLDNLSETDQLSFF